MRHLIIACAIFALAACSDQPRYVIYRDLPESPTFTVMGLTWSKNDAEYARELEPSLLSLGLRVINPPAPKRVETTSGGVQGEVSSATGGGETNAVGRAAGTTITETYNNVLEADSTHIITADWQTSSIRVIEKKTGQILAAQQLRAKASFSGGLSERELLAGVLKNLGFKVREDQ